MMGRALIFAGYFGLIGYTIGKSGIDRKIAIGVKNGYTELVRYTKAVSPPMPLVIEEVTHGKATPQAVS
jgi:hypothetical protein